VDFQPFNLAPACCTAIAIAPLAIFRRPKTRAVIWPSSGTASRCDAPNTEARSIAGLEELGSKLVALWVINRQRDSLELLRECEERDVGEVLHAALRALARHRVGVERLGDVRLERVQAP
jgi:hypothetical protein